MSTSKGKGFAAFSKKDHRAASAKGGRKTGPKGFSVMTTEQRKEIGRHGAQIRWAKERAKQTKPDKEPTI